MGAALFQLANTVDGLRGDVAATLVSVTKSIDHLRHDTTGILTNVTNGCLKNLDILIGRVDHTTFLLTNAILRLITAIALGLLLHLTYFSPMLRAIVWSMFASLCLHMLFTYIRHSRSSPGSIKGAITDSADKQKMDFAQYRNLQLEYTIEQCQSHSRVNLNGKQLTDRDIYIAVKQAIINKQCKELWLNQNQITSVGVSILAEALHDNITLKELYLRVNHVSDKGANFLAKILASSNNTLKTLDLRENGITDTGAEYLAEMLKINTRLTYLWVSSNEISDQGVRLLAEALENHNTSLGLLDLSNNKLVTDSSVDSLCNVIKHNQSLKTLDVYCCNFSDMSKEKLRQNTRSKKNFTLDE